MLPSSLRISNINFTDKNQLDFQHRVALLVTMTVSSSALRLMLVAWMCTSAFVHGARIKDNMYTPINGASCFRRLNGTHETGCSSKFGGSVGVLHLIRTAADFQFVSNNPPSPPYALIVTPDLFTRANILPLKNNPHVSGILLVKQRANTVTRSFSQELQCPNQRSNYNNATCSESNVWNSFGTGLMHESFPFPIYYIEDRVEIERLTDCFDKFNAADQDSQHQRSLCAIEIKQFMSASVNTEVCLRRSRSEFNVSPTRYCDPLSGRNVYATLYPREVIGNEVQRDEQLEEKFILVTARLDTTSMFDGVGVGAQEFIAAATLISTAHILAKLLPERIASDHPNVLFMLFNGESYDYIGSQRFQFDLHRGGFPSIGSNRHPVAAQSVQLMIDIGDLNDLTRVNVYHNHEFEMQTKLVALLDKYNRNFALKVNTFNLQTENFPPTSAQSFLRQNATFPVVALHSPAQPDTQTNQFYHSVLDDTANIGFVYANTTLDFTQLGSLTDNTASPFADDSVQMAVRNASTLLAFALYELTTEKFYSGTQGGSAVLADELLHCYLETMDCPLFRAAFSAKNTPVVPIAPPRYISVQQVSATSAWTYRVLGYLVGQPRDMGKDNCTVLPLSWYNGWNGDGECRYTTQNMSTALSPAFIIDGYDFTSGRYSTWSESTWQELSARIFLKPSSSHEALTLAIGFVVMTISFVFVFLVNSKSDILFGEALATHVASPIILAAPSQC